MKFLNFTDKLDKKTWVNLEIPNPIKPLLEQKG